MAQFHEQDKTVWCDQLGSTLYSLFISFALSSTFRLQQLISTRGKTGNISIIIVLFRIGERRSIMDNTLPQLN